MHAIEDIETTIEKDKDLCETVEVLKEKILKRFDQMKSPMEDSDQ